MDKEFADKLKHYASLVEEALDAFLPPEDASYQKVISAMRHSLLGGGKRLRPALFLEFYRLCGGDDVKTALPFACALEMIHTYSLIHDDLPCMDDADLRRGRPTCHTVYGEAVALLAGDGLLTRAFEVMSAPEHVKGLPPERVLAVIFEISRSAGYAGMVGGQTMDMEAEAPACEDRLLLLQQLKTGALIRASCLGGASLAGCTEAQAAAAAEFARCLGLAFQIRDDMLDVIGDKATLGKPVGGDERSGKATFATLAGLRECEKRIAALSCRAIAALHAFDDAGFLVWLTKSLVNRTK